MAIKISTIKTKKEPKVCGALAINGYAPAKIGVIKELLLAFRRSSLAFNPANSRKLITPRIQIKFGDER